MTLSLRIDTYKVCFYTLPCFFFMLGYQIYGNCNQKHKSGGVLIFFLINSNIRRLQQTAMLLQVSMFI